MPSLTYRLSYILLAAILALSSCKKNDDEPSMHIPSDAVYDFATLVESSSQGSILELQKVDDSPVIRYTSSIDLAHQSTHVDVGDRVIICYKRIGGEPYTTGQITLYGYATLANTEQALQIGSADDFHNWASEPFYIESMWRTGKFINMQVRLYGFQSLKPEQFILIADKTTINDEYPQLYMIYANKEGNNGENPFSVNASFDIDAVWSLPTCIGVRINYPTKDGYSLTTFTKSNK